MPAGTSTAAAAPAGPALSQVPSHKHHSHPGDTLEDAHVVQLQHPHMTVTVGEDEPAKHAVEARISDIEVAEEGRPHSRLRYDEDGGLAMACCAAV